MRLSAAINRRYQYDRFGAKDGEVAVVEVGALNARSADSYTHLDRDAAERIDCVRRRLAENRPVFVVVYGLGYRGEYEQIVGQPLDEGIIRRRQDVACVLARHPATHGPGSAYWTALGSRLRGDYAQARSSRRPS